MTIPEIQFKRGTYQLNEQPNYNFQLNRVIQWDAGNYCNVGNPKGALFMALLRAVGIPCCIHGFMIDKKLQKSAMTGICLPAGITASLSQLGGGAF